jgi:hypothetical protein
VVVGTASAAVVGLGAAPLVNRLSEVAEWQYDGCAEAGR